MIPNPLRRDCPGHPSRRGGIGVRMEGRSLGRLRRWSFHGNRSGFSIMARVSLSFRTLIAEHGLCGHAPIMSRRFSRAGAPPQDTANGWGSISQKAK
jgi:hypothetical protein